MLRTLVLATTLIAVAYAGCTQDVDAAFSALATCSTKSTTCAESCTMVTTGGYTGTVTDACKTCTCGNCTVEVATLNGACKFSDCSSLSKCQALYPCSDYMAGGCLANFQAIAQAATMCELSPANCKKACPMITPTGITGPFTDTCKTCACNKCLPPANAINSVCSMGNCSAQLPPCSSTFMCEPFALGAGTTNCSNLVNGMVAKAVTCELAKCKAECPMIQANGPPTGPLSAVCKACACSKCKDTAEAINIACRIGQCGSDPSTKEVCGQIFDCPDPNCVMMAGSTSMGRSVTEGSMDVKVVLPAFLGFLVAIWATVVLVAN